jgi:hypothetical protein
MLGAFTQQLWGEQAFGVTRACSIQRTKAVEWTLAVSENTLTAVLDTGNIFRGVGLVEAGLK